MDPVSLAASIAGLATLAGTVVSKGYQYLRAVKTCEEEVRKLIVETNVFCGIVERLARFADDEEEADGLSSTAPAKIPDHISACHNTLNEILSILERFERKAPSTSAATNSIIISSSQVLAPSTPKPSKRINIFSRLTFSDLKWPLSRSRTLELISDLERHKSTCILALSADEIVAMRSIMEQANVTQRVVTDIRSDQIRFMDMALVQDQDEKTKQALKWLSPVSPEDSHLAARNLRQQGTGGWILDLPQYSTWIQKRNTGLWVYGIPGAGKTVLASLVIDEALSMRRMAVAYFYCSYRSSESQQPVNILGSLIAQLGLKDPGALREVVTCFSDRHTAGKPPTRLNERELCTLFRSVSRHLHEVTLIIDGLDECGSSIDLDRGKLVRTLADLRYSTTGSIRLAIFSRDEGDIRAELPRFSSVSVAAQSSDIQRFVQAKAGSLRIKDKDLEAEIMKALVHGAKGMFQWVRCQIDYIGGLPNNRERRKALNDLPPTLPEIYIRIFERIDSKYPPQTQLYIKRIFKWLVLADEAKPDDIKMRLYLKDLAQAICIEEDFTELDREAVPDETAVSDWCGSLVRIDRSAPAKALELSHYTVKEFLLSGEKSVRSDSPARKYLVNRQRDQNYIADTCLTFLSFDIFNVPLPPLNTNAESKPENCDHRMEKALGTTRQELPFYKYSAGTLFYHLLRYQHGDSEAGPFQRFFIVDSERNPDRYWMFPNQGCFHGYPHDASSLQVAVYLLLTQTVERLLRQGGDPNARFESGSTPLHCAIVSDLNHAQAPVSEVPQAERSLGRSVKEKNNDARRLLTVQSLISAGANINAVTRGNDRRNAMSSLHLAISFEWPAICMLLLKAGAKLTPESEGLGEKYEAVRGLLFQRQFLKHEPAMKEVLMSIREASSDPVLLAILNLENDKGGNLSHSICIRNEISTRLLNRDLAGKSFSPSRLVYERYLSRHPPLEVKALKSMGTPILSSPCQMASIFCPFEGKHDDFTLKVAIQHNLLSTDAWQTLLNEASEHDNEDRMRSLICMGIEPSKQEAPIRPIMHLACMAKDSHPLKYLIENGADVNMQADNKDTPLMVAAQCGWPQHVRLLVSKSAEVNLPGRDGWTALHHATWTDCLAAGTDCLATAEILVESGAKFNYALNDYRTALHLAARKIALEIVTFLLSKGVNPDLKNIDKSTALHIAIVRGFEGIVEKLLSLEVRTKESLEASSTAYGTPLYAAASRNSAGIVKKLLDAGAEIDRIVPENALGPPLFVAVARGHTKVVELLLSRGARTEAVGCHYRTAIEVAKINKSWEALEILERWELVRVARCRIGAGEPEQQSKPVTELENELSAQIKELKILVDAKSQPAHSLEHRAAILESPSPRDGAAGSDASGEEEYAEWNSDTD